MIMSSPFDSGRDSGQASGTSFDAEADVADSHVSAFNMEALASHPNRLGESDYR